MCLYLCPPDLGTNESGVQNPKKDPVARSRLFDAACAAKVALSSQKSVIIDIPSLDSARRGVRCELTRNRFEALTRGLLVRLLKPLREVAIMSGINLPGESSELSLQMRVSDDDTNMDDSDDYDARTNGILTKGRIQAMRLAQESGRQLSKIRKKMKGNTQKELRRLQKDYLDSSITTFPGGQALDDVILVGGATRIPAVQRLIHTVTGIKPKLTVNPDEAVSLGAAVLAGILDGDIKDMQVMSAWQAAMYRVFYDEQVNKKKGGNTSDSFNVSNGETTNSSMNSVLEVKSAAKISKPNKLKSIIRSRSERQRK